MEQSEKQAEEGLVDEAQALLAEVSLLNVFHTDGGRGRADRGTIWSVCIWEVHVLCTLA